MKKFYSFYINLNTYTLVDQTIDWLEITPLGSLVLKGLDTRKEDGVSGDKRLI